MSTRYRYKHVTKSIKVISLNIYKLFSTQILLQWFSGYRQWGGGEEGGHRYAEYIATAWTVLLTLLYLELSVTKTSLVFQCGERFPCPNDLITSRPSSSFLTWWRPCRVFSCEYLRPLQFQKSLHTLCISCLTPRCRSVHPRGWVCSLADYPPQTHSALILAAAPSACVRWRGAWRETREMCSRVHTPCTGTKSRQIYAEEYVRETGGDFLLWSRRQRTCEP